MAAFEDGSTIPRKRITTYGKANRRRIPDFSFTPVPHSEISGAITPQYEEMAGSKDASTANGKVIPSQKNLRPEIGSQSADVNMLLSGEDTAPARPKSKPITKKEISKASQKTSQMGVKGTLKGSRKVINTPRSPVSQISSSPSSPPTSSNIYDMPSSEDEPTPKPVKRTIQRINQKSTQPSNSKVGNGVTTQLEDLPEDTKGNKRRRLSPKQPAQMAQPTKKAIPENPTLTKRVLPELAQTQMELPKVHPIRMATRPKIQVRKTKPEPIQPPLEAVSASKNVLSSNSPSPGPTNTADGGNSANHVSPKAIKTWKGFLDSAGEEDSDTVMGNMDGYSKSPQKHVSISPPPVPSRTLSKPAGISKRPQKPVRRMPRRRLIDTLVEQAPEEESSEEDKTSTSSDESEIARRPEEPAKMTHDEFAKILSQTLGHDPTPSPAIMPASQSSQGVGPRVTYSRQRSMLAESDLMSQLALDMPMQHTEGSQHEKPRRGVISPLKKLTSFNEDAEMSDQAPAVTSVHELRQAGANQRFMEEVEDLLDRIGKPVSPSSTMRRSGLSELASKMKDKTFLRQFRDNGIEQRLFLHLGLEQDVVAGFYMISLLMVVLLDANMPHVVAHLRRHGVTRLLIRLVGTPQGAVKLGKERKNNMSKMALALLTEHHDSLLRLPVWGQLEPQLLSPRTVALKCLELMVRQTREAGKSDDIFSKEMTTLLFDILRSASDESLWALPKGQQAVDFFLALSILELHSIKAMTAHDESIWISEYLPIVADTVEILLGQPAENAGELQYMLLRLIVNVTNNDPKASDVFARQGVMNSLGQAIITKFTAISRFMTEEDLTEAVAQLVVGLGVMINLSESPAARKCFNSLRGNPDDPLAKMVELFIGNQENMAEANTQEESQRNVPFGYLSILLGYMCLDLAISERIQQRLPGRTLRPLLSSIEQFISYHKAVDDMLEAEEDGYSRQTGLTERLESLVQKLVAI